jgi:hypothetical protein
MARRLTTNQEIAGSIPASINLLRDDFLFATITPAFELQLDDATASYGMYGESCHVQDMGSILPRRRAVSQGLARTAMVEPRLIQCSVVSSRRQSQLA